jgi:cell division protein FtsB
MPLLNLLAARRTQAANKHLPPDGGREENKVTQTKKEKHMSAKEVGLIVIFAFIIIGGFIFLAPEYQKNAQLKETYAQNQKLVEHVQAEIDYKTKLVRKLDAGDASTITRILRERFLFCPPNEKVIQFKDIDNNVKQAE